jgi:hypothetical protein
VTAAVRIEVLHHEGCPLFAPALALVRDCVRELGVDAIVSERVARSPSPTVLVDGRDVMGVPDDELSVEACRLDVPTRERVTDALRSALSSPKRPDSLAGLGPFLRPSDRYLRGPT